MKTKNMFIVFVVVAIVQAFVPLKMIYDTEKINDEGTVYKFKTQPIDPSDPFRGKYITLRFEAESFKTTDSLMDMRQDLYVSIEKDSEGYARVKEVLREEPEEGDYFKAETYYFSTNGLHLSFPFDRFYMEESKAPQAEVAYRKYSAAKNPKPAYALVAIKDGQTYLKDVIVDDKPIREYVMEQQE
ncbi:GDYXXLXY domain-containing protein [Flavobacterium sp. C4GT6]|uniref:GDYXXLXY domain-containing protein n=1 Tax=Flavobacterium sp. C4GT6 TaxID=3103818 RepID=UPI002ED37D73